MFAIKYRDSIVSGFTIEVDDRQYLLTAKHSFEGIKEGDSIQVFRDSKWYSITVKPIYCEPTQVDIIVLALPYHIYALMTEGTHADAQVPIAYGTALVLIMLVLGLDVVAIIIRTRARKKKAW